jgi:hypothetical protein
MGFIKPTLPTVDPATWPGLGRLERIQALAPFWVENGFGTQRVVHLLYVVKCLVFTAGAIVVASLSTPGLGGITEVGQWWSEPVFFQKAVVYALLFEILGLGCGSGPLTLRINPPIGGVLYWLRPGTVRLPPWPDRVPLTRGTTRGAVDIVLYAGVLAAGVWLLLAPAGEATLDGADLGVVAPSRVVPLLVLLPLLGLRDRTIFLAARSEHYLLTAVLFVFPVVPMLAGAQLVMLLLWWGAATSKLNRHFPFVVSIMISNAPLHQSKWLRRKLYRHFPDDLRPGRLANLLAYGGTATEFAVPLVLLLAPNQTVSWIAVVVMVAFHLHILSTFPMGVPMEWNVFMMFATLFLFGSHGSIGPSQVDSPAMVAILVAAVAVVVLGNLFPDRFSFLMSMRYYAGNWATSLWLFKRPAQDRLDSHITKVAPAVRTQLEGMYGPADADLVLNLGNAWRAMHHHGRALNGLLPRAVDDLDGYEVVEGETVAGVVLGWNFGDGHLHDEQLLAAIQERCGYDDADVRVVMLESQPIHRAWQHYRIVDAATGLVEEGHIRVEDMVRRQPWLDGDPSIEVTPLPTGLTGPAKPGLEVA